MTNLIASLIAYSFQEKKPAIQFDTTKNQQISLFY